MKKLIIILIALALAAAGGICFVIFGQSEKNEQTSGKQMTVTVSGKSFTAQLYDNKTADELYSRLPLTAEMKELNSNEKYYDLPESLTNDSKAAGKINKGDIKLYRDNCIVLFYDSFSSSYSYTDIGYITDTEGLEDALGSGDVTVTFSSGKEEQMASESLTESETTAAATMQIKAKTTTTAKTTKKVTEKTTAVSTTTTTTPATTTKQTVSTKADTTTTKATSAKRTTKATATVTTTAEVTAQNTAAAQIPKEEEKTMKMEISGKAVSVEWEENASVQALKELCRSEPLEIQMSMYGGFEQVGSIGQSIERDDTQTTTAPGDIVLYSGDQIVVFYGTNSWSYTRLGKITDCGGSTLKELLANGDVTIRISYE